MIENLFRFIQSCECDNAKIPNIQQRKQSKKYSKPITKETLEEIHCKSINKMIRILLWAKLVLFRTK